MLAIRRGTCHAICFAHSAPIKLCHTMSLAHSAPEPDWFAGRSHLKPNNIYQYIRILSALVGSLALAFSRGLIKVLQHLTNNTHTMNTIIHILNITIHKLTRLRDRLVNRNIEKFLSKCNKNNTYIEMRGM